MKRANFFILMTAGAVLMALSGRSGLAANYPHDTTGRRFPAFLYEGQESAPSKTQLESLTSDDIQFSSNQKRPDNRGSRVSKVRRFTVDVKPHLLPPNKEYVVVYYVDGVPVRQYEQVRLPFEFVRDFRGHKPGSYEIRIDIEDSEGNRLATRTTTVTVSP